MTTTTAKPKPSGRRPAKQEAIPGTRIPKNRKVENAAAKYVEARDERMAWNDEEAKAKDKLISVLVSEEVDHYETDDWVIDLTVKDPTRQVKVKRRDVDSGEDEAAE